MTKDQALRLALEALLEYQDHLRGQAITAIKQALEQPEGNPVAWKDRTYGNLHHQDFGNSIPLYTSPPKRKPLTDEQIDALPFPPSGTATLRDFVRIIEAAHGIKGEA